MKVLWFLIVYVKMWADEDYFIHLMYKTSKLHIIIACFNNSIAVNWLVSVLDSDWSAAVLFTI